MARPSAALWLSVLVALLGGPQGSRSEDRTWSSATSVQRAPSGRTPEIYVRAVSQWHTALDARARKDHHPLGHGGSLAAAPAATTVGGEQVASPAPRPFHRVPTRPSDYAVLTTGPPSHT